MPISWTNSVIITVDEAPLDPLVKQQLESVTVDTSLHLPDMFELRFIDPARDVVELGLFMPGSLVSISVMSAAEDPLPLIQGEITALEFEYELGLTYKIIRGLDRSNRLMHGKKVRMFQDMMASEIVESILAENGLEVSVVEPTDDVYPYKAQVGVTDWDFIQMLAVDNGYRAYMADGIFNFGPIMPPDEAMLPGTFETPSLASQLVLGKDLIRVRGAVRSSEQVDDVQVMGWSPLTDSPVVGVSPSEPIGVLLDSEGEMGPVELAALAGANSFVYLDYPGEDEDAAETKAAAVGNQLAESYTELDGLAYGRPELRAGFAVNLAFAGAPFDGAYTITSAKHIINADGGYVTQFTCSGWQEKSMLGMVEGSKVGVMRSPERMPGVCSATVVNCRDPESLGRVQVWYEWMGEGAMTGWIRCAQIGASEAFGFLWIPEEGDEVIVAFEQGDPSRPIVIGSLYNTEMNPAVGPETVDEVTGLISERRISSRFQHNITFYDSEETSGIMIATGDEVQGVFLNAEESSLSIYNLEGTIEIDAVSITINAEADLTISTEGELALSGSSITIEGEGDVLINGASVAIAADGDLSIEAPIVAING